MHPSDFNIKLSLPEDQLKLSFAKTISDQAFSQVDHLPRYGRNKLLIDSLNMSIQSALKRINGNRRELPDKTALKIGMAKLISRLLKYDYGFSLKLDIQLIDGQYAIVPCNLSSLIFIGNIDAVPKTLTDKVSKWESANARYCFLAHDTYSITLK